MKYCCGCCAEEAPKAAAGGKAGGKAAPAKAAAPAKGGKAAAEPAADAATTKTVLSLEAAVAVAATALAQGKAVYEAALAAAADVKRKQSRERDRLWQNHLTSIAAEKEAREAAAEAAAGNKPKGKAPAKAAAKPGSAKRKGEESDKPTGPFPFITEAVLDVVCFEARRLWQRLQFLHRRCVSECTQVSNSADTLWASLNKRVPAVRCVVVC